MLRRFAPFALLTLAILAAPSADASVLFGAPADAGTGNCYPFGCPSDPSTASYQQVYASSGFGGPISITGLQFFNTALDNGATQTALGTFDIFLSTTSATPATLSTTFASNLGGDNTQVFNGSINQVWTFGDTLSINFVTPFNYDPSSGNLLLSVNVSGGSEPDGAIYFDARNGTATNMGRVNGSGTDGSIDTNWGLVTNFVTADVPEPGTIGLTLIGGAFLFLARKRQQRMVGRFNS